MVVEGWGTYRLADLGELNRGKSKHRPRDAKHLYGGPYPFLQTGDIKAADGLVTTHSQTYSEAGLAQSRLWPKGTVAITIAANIAETAILGFEACFPDSVVGFIADEEKTSGRFVEYLFRRLKRQIQHEHVGSGSVQDNINLGILNQLEFDVPPLTEQVQILRVLGSLDDKIELNRRMNETLEEMARALFRDWFVDFGPTRRQMAMKEQGLATDPAAIMGQAFPPEKAATLAPLFPEKLGEDGLPEGWVEQPFETFVEIIGGGTPKTKIAEYWGKDIPWFSVVDAPTQGAVYVHSTDKSITTAGLENSSARMVPEGTTIISARGTVGKIGMAPGDMTFNQSCYALRPKKPVGERFVFLATGQLVERLQAMAHGSVFSTITRNTFSSLSFAGADEPCYSAFEEITAPLFAKIKTNGQENHTLAQMRDLLLPKLMSGEIRLKDAEKK